MLAKLNSLAGWPTLSRTNVVHIGTLQEAQKGCHGDSYEGHGLSVSTHPSAWEQIARLGGLPWWSLSCPRGRFLDMHNLKANHHEAVTAWGQAQQLIQACPVFKVPVANEMGEHDGYFVFDDKADAQLEAEEDGLDVQETSGWRATPALCARMKQERIDLGGVLTMVTLAYADACLDVDGAWWADNLAPYALSAPRGVIFPDRLKRWTTLSLASR